MKFTNLFLALVLFQFHCVFAQNWYNYLSNTHMLDCLSNHDYYLYDDGTYLDKYGGVVAGPTTTSATTTRTERRGDWVLHNADKAITTLSLQDFECSKSSTYLGIFPPYTSTSNCPLKTQMFHITQLDNIELNMYMKCRPDEQEEAGALLKVASDCSTVESCTWGQWTISDL